MKAHSKRNRIRTPLQDNILSLIGVISLILLTLAAVAGVLWMLIRFGVLTYDWNFFDPQTEETAQIGNADGIFDILRPISDNTEDSSQNSPEVIRFSGSFSTLRALLSDLQLPDQYQAQFETILYADTNAKSTVHIYRSGTSYRINRYAPGTSSANNATDVYICNGDAVVYTDNRTKTSVQFPVSESFSPEALAGIPSIESFNEIPDEQILHASYTELSGEIVYYVLYDIPTTSDNRIVHEIWISADTELVMRCNTYLCTAKDDPMGIIGQESAKLFSSQLTHVSALSDREQKVLFTLPEISS